MAAPLALVRPSQLWLYCGCGCGCGVELLGSCDLNIQLFDDQGLIGINAVAVALLMARLEGRDHGINALLSEPREHQGLLGRGIAQGQADPDLRLPRLGISAISLAMQHLLRFCHQQLHLIRQGRQQLGREGSAEMHLPPARWRA